MQFINQDFKLEFSFKCPSKYLKDLREMIKKFTLIFCLSLAAIFLVLNSFDDGQTRLSDKNNHSAVSKRHGRIASIKLATEDDMVAAILIMPKSYLPAFKRFSHSKRAKHIKFLQAELELKDGEMTAIYKMKNDKKRDRGTLPANGIPNKSRKVKLDQRPENESQLVAAVILYLMANVHKNRLYR